MEIIGIMSRDRYKSKGPNYKYIQLNTHISKKAATNYGAAVVNFINRVFGENLFSYDQISPTLRSGDGLYNCRINVRDNQVRYLAGKGILPI